MRQSWLAKGQPSRGRWGGEAAGEAGESLALRTGVCSAGGGAGAQQPSSPSPAPSPNPGAHLALRERCSRAPLPSFGRSNVLSRGGLLLAAIRWSLTAIKPSAAMPQPLSRELKSPKVFLSSYLTRQMSLAHPMPCKWLHCFSSLPGFLE